MEKAFLVDVCLRTRVVVDVPEHWEDSEDKICELACKRLTEQVLSNDNPICLDNVVEVVEDYECPFGSFDEDNE